MALEKGPTFYTELLKVRNLPVSSELVESIDQNSLILHNRVNKLMAHYREHSQNAFPGGFFVLPSELMTARIQDFSQETMGEDDNFTGDFQLRLALFGRSEDVIHIPNWSDLASGRRQISPDLSPQAVALVALNISRKAYPVSRQTFDVYRDLVIPNSLLNATS